MQKQNQSNRKEWKLAGISALSQTVKCVRMFNIWQDTAACPDKEEKMVLHKFVATTSTGICINSGQAEFDQDIYKFGVGFIICTKRGCYFRC